MWNQRAKGLRTVAVEAVGAIGLAAAATFLAAPQHAFAQNSRAEVIRQEQANRQRAVTPPRPNRAERVVESLERWGLITGTPRGLYPWVGSVYPGGGLAAGPALRASFGDDGAASVFGGYSINGFTRAQGDVALPTFARNRARLTLSGQYLDAPDVDYYGVGNASSKADRSRFGYKPKGGGAALDLDVSRHLSIGGGVSYFDIETSGGKTGASIGDQFSLVDTPGLERAQFTYLVSTARAEFDWRRPLGYSGRGGLYRAQFDDYRERDNGAYTFRAVEVEARQLIPIMRANWVVALRALATVTDVDDTSAVPYFMLPSLGGGATLRGYSNFRFRDNHRLLMNAELRWTPARFLDMAVFYDTGKVSSERRDLDFTDLRSSYGIGMRVVGVNGYALRLEVARSSENAAHVLVTTGGSF
jgi:outer membrane protein assembly factor BamA